MHIIWIKFYDLINKVNDDYMKKCISDLSHNILPYNVFSINNDHISFTSFQNKYFFENVYNKTPEQLIFICKLIFDYSFSHLKDPSLTYLQNDES